MEKIKKGLSGCDLSLILFFTKYHFYFIKNYLIRQSGISEMELTKETVSVIFRPFKQEKGVGE